MNNYEDMIISKQTTPEGTTEYFLVVDKKIVTMTQEKECILSSLQYYLENFL